MSPQPVLPRLQPLREDYRSAGVKTHPPAGPAARFTPQQGACSLAIAPSMRFDWCLRSESNGAKHPVPFWEVVRPPPNPPRRPGSPHSKKLDPPATSRPYNSLPVFNPQYRPSSQNETAPSHRKALLSSRVPCHGTAFSRGPRPTRFWHDRVGAVPEKSESECGFPF